MNTEGEGRTDSDMVARLKRGTVTSAWSSASAARTSCAGTRTTGEAVRAALPVTRCRGRRVRRQRAHPQGKESEGRLENGFEHGPREGVFQQLRQRCGLERLEELHLRIRVGPGAPPRLFELRPVARDGESSGGRLGRGRVGGGGRKAA